MERHLSILRLLVVAPYAGAGALYHTKCVHVIVFGVMEAPVDVFGVQSSLIYAVFVPVILFLFLFLLRISRSLMSPMGADTIMLLIGVDILVPTNQLEIKNIISIPGNPNEIFTVFIIFGFLLVAMSVWLEEVYYHAISTLKEEGQAPFMKYVLTLLTLLLTYVPSGMFMAMHVALITMFPARHV